MASPRVVHATVAFWTFFQRNIRCLCRKGKFNFNRQYSSVRLSPLVLLQLDHNALLVSPHYHHFRDDNPPTSAEYLFIAANRCCIPLLAILTFLLLPNETVRQGFLPAVRNVISVQEMGKNTKGFDTISDRRSYRQKGGI